jgi:hypothetical protein
VLEQLYGQDDTLQCGSEQRAVFSSSSSSVAQLLSMRILQYICIFVVGLRAYVLCRIHNYGNDNTRATQLRRGHVNHAVLFNLACCLLRCSYDDTSNTRNNRNTKRSFLVVQIVLSHAMLAVTQVWCISKLLLL